MSDGFDCCDLSFIWTWSSKWACGVEVWNHMGLKVKGVVPRSPQKPTWPGWALLAKAPPRAAPVHAYGATPGQASNPPGEEKKRDYAFSAQIYSLGPRTLEQLCFLLISLDHSAHFRKKSVIFTLLLCVIIFPVLWPVQFRATASAICKCQLNAHQAFTCNK